MLSSGNYTLPSIVDIVIGGATELTSQMKLEDVAILFDKSIKLLWNNPQHLLRLLKSIIDHYCKLSQYHNAIKYSLQLEEILSPGNEEFGILLYNIGVMYYKVRECNYAMKYLKRSLKFSLEHKDRAGEANCYCNLGDAKLYLRHYEEAIELYYKSEKIYLEIGNRRGMANIYISLGNSFRAVENFEKAIDYCDKGLSTSSKIGYHSGEGKANADLGIVYLYTRKFMEAIKHFEKALCISLEIADRSVELICYVHIGSAYFSLEQFEKAACYFRKYFNIFVATIYECDKDKALRDSASTCLESNKKIQCYFTKTNFISSLFENQIKNRNECFLNAVVCLSLGQYQHAIGYCTKSLNISSETGDREGEALAYLLLGNAYIGLQVYDKAIKHNKEALDISIRIENIFIQGWAVKHLGISYHSLGQYTEASKYNHQHLEMSLKLGNRSDEGDGWANLGLTYFRLDQYDHAVEYYEKALSIHKEIGIRENIAKTFCNLGLLYVNLGQYERAIDYLKKGLRIGLEIGDRSLTGKVYGNLGSAYYNIGQLKLAVHYHLKCTSICVDLGDRTGEATACAALGDVFGRTGQYQKALEHYTKSILLFRTLGNRTAVGSIVGNLGNVYESLGQLDRAIRYYEEGLAINIELRNRLGESRNYGFLGNAFVSLGRYEEAINCHKKHYNISLELGARAGEGHALANLGSAHRQLRQFDEAISCCEKGLAISMDIGDRSDEAIKYCNLAETYQCLGKYQKATEYFRKGLAISLETGDQALEGQCNASLGLCSFMMAVNDLVNGNATTLSVRGVLSNAVSLLKNAIQSTDRLLFELTVDKNKTSFCNKYYNWHVTLACSLIFLQRMETALLVFDLGKAKALQLLIEQRKRSRNQAITTDPYRGETWRMINTENDKERLIDISKDLQLQQDDATLLVYAFDLFKLLHIWVINGNGGVQHRAWMPQADVTSAEDWLRTAIEKLLSIASVNIRGEHSFFHFSTQENFAADNVFHQTSQNLPSFFSKCDRSTLFQCDFVGNNTRQTSAATIHTTSSNSSNTQSQLYLALINPVEDLITGSKLIIAPDKSLFFVPFCSLLDRNDCPLTEHYSIQMTPSFHTLASSMLVQYSTSLGPVLFVGNPTVGEISFRGKRLDLSLKSLPSATDEAKSLASRFDATALVEDKATKDRVLHCIHDASIVHIAAHGEPNNGEIFLAPNPEYRNQATAMPTEKSYLLRQSDVIDRQLTARLVVLSCCDTGLGDVTSEGVLGLARSFLGAGARSVLVALWPIPDQATKVFMKHFYDELCQGKRACEALKASMNMFQESSNDIKRSFRAWAPFTIFGEDVKFTTKDIEQIKERSREVAKQGCD